MESFTSFWAWRNRKKHAFREMTPQEFDKDILACLDLTTKLLLEEIASSLSPFLAKSYECAK